MATLARVMRVLDYKFQITFVEILIFDKSKDKCLGRLANRVDQRSVQQILLLFMLIVDALQNYV